ncbi:PREDICTED: salicylic acid-binding protein 2-like [Ipomoea nil]|uniref:salicylic acid-binding protein 2-like n=1 Tax=Ipomoea nil TaxID=35883 RepID=UPI000900E9A0|nr:PREDICTED: salicylic acid-binding protein 2-like [Ipomoea nil]
MEKKRKCWIPSFLCLVFLLHSSASATTTSAGGPKPGRQNQQFVLVHGACHGAWSWYKLLGLLRSSGHNATAVDLGAAGINPKGVLELRRQADYFRPLMEFMASVPAGRKQVILVAHSLGGLAVSKAMEEFPEKISVAVFVTALMPGPSLNATTVMRETNRGNASQLDNLFTFDNGLNNPPTTFIFGPNYLAANLYQLSPIEDLALASTVLRPIHLYSEKEVSKEMVLSDKQYGSVKRVFIISGQDKVVRKEFQEWMIKKNPPDEVKEVLGSDHMVMMSKPFQLFHLLQKIAHSHS